MAKRGSSAKLSLATPTWVELLLFRRLFYYSFVKIIIKNLKYEYLTSTSWNCPAWEGFKLFSWHRKFKYPVDLTLFDKMETPAQTLSL